MTLDELKESAEKIVILHLEDGEILKAKVYWISLANYEYDDIIVDVIETNQPDHYTDPSAAYTIQCGLIQSVEICELSN